MADWHDDDLQGDEEFALQDWEAQKRHKREERNNERAARREEGEEDVSDDEDSEFNNDSDDDGPDDLDLDEYWDEPEPFHHDPNYTHEDATLPDLGLLNGRYAVRITIPETKSTAVPASSLVLTLEGNALWGTFKLQPDLDRSLEGVVHFTERPMYSSGERRKFTWRATSRAKEQKVCSGDGWMRFQGGGTVDGSVQGERLAGGDSFIWFEGTRAPGQDTRSEIHADEMRRDWEQLGAQLSKNLDEAA
ncbi:hypothetical protein GGR57DRAFT_478159 [Xylariaceae sp. FL1272]|nr:hypothetical protein GGR57DRAFT_478159 [Xylariaceae sp. FL1272]